jgi:general secretion pathway protein M
MKETAKSWWRQLARRERLLIAWGGTGLLAALCYAYLWQPLNIERTRLRASLPQMRADAALMAAQAEEAAILRQDARPPLSGPALQAAIQQAGNEAGLDAKKMQIALLDEHRASISIESSDFDHWLSLTAQLQRDNHVRLESCSVEALAEAGMARVQAVMAAASK